MNDGSDGRKVITFNKVSEKPPSKVRIKFREAASPPSPVSLQHNTPELTPPGYTAPAKANRPPTTAEPNIDPAKLPKIGPKKNGGSGRSR